MCYFVVITDIASEFPVKMVIFHSYISLPEGSLFVDLPQQKWPIHLSTSINRFILLLMNSRSWLDSCCLKIQHMYLITSNVAAFFAPSLLVADHVHVYIHNYIIMCIYIYIYTVIYI